MGEIDAAQVAAQALYPVSENQPLPSRGLFQELNPIQPVTPPAFFQLGKSNMVERPLLIPQHRRLRRQPCANPDIDSMTELRQKLQTDPIAQQLSVAIGRIDAIFKFPFIKIFQNLRLGDFKQWSNNLQILIRTVECKRARRTHPAQALPPRPTQQPHQHSLGLIVCGMCRGNLVQSPYPSDFREETIALLPRERLQIAAAGARAKLRQINFSQMKCQAELFSQCANKSRILLGLVAANPVLQMGHFNMKI
ncbi:MAG TPA: hypothetical protein VF208_10145 [Candidatus Binatia bacterium]